MDVKRMSSNRGRMALILIVLCLGLLGPTVMGQVDPPDPPRPPDQIPIVGGALNELWTEIAPLLENETGQDLTHEEIDLSLFIDIRNADFDLVGIIFGGGKVDVDVYAELRLEFRAISIQRIDDALKNATGDIEVSLNSTFGVDSSRMVLTAEELRLLGGGVVLQAFQGVQERAAARSLEALLPGITVLQADFQWGNTLPGSYLYTGASPDLRDPPLILEAAVTLRYLERYSLFEILEMTGKEDPDREAAKELQRRVEENQIVPRQERSAFMFLGYGQLLDLELPHGWRMDLTLAVPKGFSIEDATAELLVDDERRAATYFIDGSERDAPFSTVGIFIITNRFLVTSTVAAVTLLAGAVLRILAEGGVVGLQAAFRLKRGK